MRNLYAMGSSNAQPVSKSKKFNDHIGSDVSVGICPECKGTDWATTTAFIKIKSPPRYRSRIIGILSWSAVIIVVGIIMFAVVKTARAELCLDKIDNTVEKRGGFRWQWRTVDGKRCWFYSNTLLPKEDLIWSYNSEEFDSDVRVIERKFYRPILDENSLFLELR